MSVAAAAWRGRKVPSNSIVFRLVGCAILLTVCFPWLFYRNIIEQTNPQKFGIGPPSTQSNQRDADAAWLSEMADAVRRKQQGDRSGGMGFIHVGKTGGSSISQLLRNGCHSMVRKNGGPCRVIPNETAVSLLVEDYYHVADFWSLPNSKHPNYIVMVRDVYDRTVSALLYHHPKNVNYYQLNETEAQRQLGSYAYTCFPSLEEFASLLKRGNSTECYYPYRHNEIVNDDCAELACAVIHGRVRHFHHLFFNFRNIQSKIPTSNPDRTLYAIRKEHLWNDWWTINSIFGEPRRYGSSWANDNTSFRNITGIDLPVNRDITDKRREQLCKALEPEYAVYFQLLQRAENIRERDLDNARQIASRNCPKLDFQRMLTS